MRRTLYAPHLRAGAIPRTPELAVALVCARHLTVCRFTGLTDDAHHCLRRASCSRSPAGNLALEQLGFQVDIDAPSFDAADRAVLGRQVFQLSVPINAAL